MAELYPTLKEAELSNVLKHARDENSLYMHWKPKSLLRLLCWRFHAALRMHGLKTEFAIEEIDWDDHKDVTLKAWEPYFGKKIMNGLNSEEMVFPYIFRHSQCRPRQLVVLCNAIARKAIEAKSFPYFKRQSIVDAVSEVEVELATEIVNSYSRIWVNCGKILNALHGVPMRFRGNLIDSWAPRSANAWPKDSYSSEAFCQLAAELGVIGRIRSCDPKRKIVEADFEYYEKDRLVLTPDSDCIIHPMFYRKLNTDVKEGYRVYPCPDSADYHFVRDTP